MKKILSMTAVAVFVMTMAGTAAAVPFDAGTVTVNGTVTGKCKVGTGIADTLDFGAIDPDLGTAASSPITGSITMFCTNKYLGYGISALSTNSGLSGDCSAGAVTGSLEVGTSAIPYTVTCSKPQGTGFGSEIDLAPVVAIGAIPADAEAGFYGDSIVITITP